MLSNKYKKLARNNSLTYTTQTTIEMQDKAIEMQDKAIKCKTRQRNL